MLAAVVRAVRDLCHGSPPLDPFSGIALGIRVGGAERVMFETWAALAERMPAEQLQKIRDAAAALPAGEVPFCVQPTAGTALIGSLSPADLMKGRS